jgi:PAS domain S-box-containing protein
MTSRLIQYVHDRAEQVLTHGFQPEWFRQAVTIAQEIISALVETVESNFVWRSLGHAQATVWDIVARERHHIELTLRESEARYQTIFDATPIMFWLKDTHNRTLRINKAAAEFEGVKQSDVEGKSAYDLYPREQAEAYYQDDLEVIRSNQPKLGIVEQHTSVGTGKLMWVETGKTPVHDNHGQVVGVLAFGIDVTERQQAEAKLREGEEQYRRAITAAGAVPYYIDYTTESYRFIGEAIEALTGYTVNEITPTLLGQMIKETIMTGQGRQLSREEAIQQARAGDLAGWNADYRLVDRSGQTHWLNDASVQVLNEQGQPIGAIGILQDVTNASGSAQFQASLEQRSRQVQTSIEVAQHIAAAPQLEELFHRVVTLIKEIRLSCAALPLRAGQDAVKLITGYGEIGQKMLASGHKLAMGRGVVGTAAPRDSRSWQPMPHAISTGVQILTCPIPGVNWLYRSSW